MMCLGGAAMFQAAIRMTKRALPRPRFSRKGRASSARRGHRRILARPLHSSVSRSDRIRENTEQEERHTGIFLAGLLLFTGVMLLFFF